jgi:energy-coupling factor transporter ATP-binding protein EcfA2
MANSDSQPRKITRPAFITKITVKNLFGYLTYVVPNRESKAVGYDRLMILYGDNGSGKTTILSLLFSILSPISGREEKTYVARTPFRSFEVSFDDGSTVIAKKQKGLVGSYTVIIDQPGKEESSFEIEPDSTGAVKTSEATGKLLARLAAFGVSLYFLPDDRNMRTTVRSEAESKDDDELTVSDEPDEFRRLTFSHIIGRSRVLWKETQESHHLEVASVLENVGSWFRSHAFLGSSAGEESATSIYLSVVEQLARMAGGAPTEDTNYQSVLVKRLKEIDSRIDEFTRFGLITPFPAGKFLDLFINANASAKRSIATVVEPYVDGIEARLNALDQIRNLIRTYVETTNEFLSNKALNFSLQAGAVVFGHSGARLDPNLLSSGEKQLVLLLSNTILAREAAGIFLIDEPELSLNVKWQRALIEALLRCSEGSNIQYILASHSLELITQHKGNAIRLISDAAVSVP